MYDLTVVDLTRYDVFYGKEKLDVFCYEKRSGLWYVKDTNNNVYDARRCSFYFIREDGIRVLKRWDLVRNHLFHYSYYVSGEKNVMRLMIKK